MWSVRAICLAIFLAGGLRKSTACVSSVHHGTCVEHAQSPFAVLHHEYTLAEPVSESAVHNCHKQCCASHPRCRWWLVTSKPRESQPRRLRHAADTTRRDHGVRSTTCALFSHIPIQPLKPLQSTPVMQCALGIAHVDDNGSAQHVPVLAELLDMSLIRRSGGWHSVDGASSGRRQRHMQYHHLSRERHRLMRAIVELQDTKNLQQSDGAMRMGNTMQLSANNSDSKSLCWLWAVPCAISAEISAFASISGIRDIADEQTTSDLLFFYPFFFGLLFIGACVRLQQDEYQEHDRNHIFDSVVRCAEETLRTINEHPAPIDGTCAICLCDWCKGDAVATLPCQHRFHRRCIVQWLRQKDACPLCNAQVGAACEYTAR